MKIDIKNKITNEIIFSHEQKNNSIKDTVKNAVELKVDMRYADLSGADLSNANLRGADFRYTDFRYTNLRDADLSNANFCYADFRYTDLCGADLRGAAYGIASISYSPVKILGLCWDIIIFDYHIKIGCKLFLTVEWEEFNDETINSFGSDALDFWHKYKEMIITAAKAHQLYNLEI